MTAFELHAARKRYLARKAISDHMLGWHYLGLAAGIVAGACAISATILAVLWGCS